MLNLSNDTCINISVLVVLAIVTLMVIKKFYKTENFANEHKEHKEHGAKHGHHKLHNAHSQLHKAIEHVKQTKTVNNGEAKPEYHLVNKRELILKNNLVEVGNNPTSIVVNDLAYGPFAYAASDSVPLPPNAQILHRLYAVYSDTMSTEGELKVRFSFGWSGDKGTYETTLPRTWGSVGYQRDAYSPFFTSSDILANGVPDATLHADVLAYTTVPGTIAGIWRLYVETWAIF